MTTVTTSEHRTAAGIRLGRAFLWQPREPWGSSSTQVSGSLSEGAADDGGAGLALALDVERSLPREVRARARTSWLHGKVVAYRQPVGDDVVLVVPGTVMSLTLMGEALRRHHYGHEDRLAA